MAGHSCWLEILFRRWLAAPAARCHDARILFVLRSTGKRISTHFFWMAWRRQKIFAPMNFFYCVRSGYLSISSHRSKALRMVHEKTNIGSCIMGWTYFHRPSGQTMENTFRKEFDFSNEYGSCEVVACSSKLTTSYLAIRRTYPDGKSYVFGMVCLINHCPKSYYNFGYKDISEEMGPCQTECPGQILNLLSPLEEIYSDLHSEGGGKWAKEWRDACLARLAKPKPKKGDLIKFKHPIRFTGGFEHDTFKFLGKSYIEVNGWRYRISGLQDREFEIVENT
jgi:hypothetical protein